ARKMWPRAKLGSACTDLRQLSIPASKCNSSIFLRPCSKKERARGDLVVISIPVLLGRANSGSAQKIVKPMVRTRRFIAVPLLLFRFLAFAAAAGSANFNGARALPE